MDQNNFKKAKKFFDKHEIQKLMYPYNKTLRDIDREKKDSSHFTSSFSTINRDCKEIEYDPLLLNLKNNKSASEILFCTGYGLDFSILPKTEGIDGSKEEKNEVEIKKKKAKVDKSIQLDDDSSVDSFCSVKKEKKIEKLSETSDESDDFFSRFSDSSEDSELEQEIKKKKLKKNKKTVEKVEEDGYSSFDDYLEQL